MICAFCYKNFVPTSNSQKFCSFKCYKANKNNTQRPNDNQTCHYCGEYFKAPRKKKYCSEKCRLAANGRYSKTSKSTSKTKPKKSEETLTEAIANARKLGLTYGQYVALQMTKGGK